MNGGNMLTLRGDAEAARIYWHGYQGAELMARDSVSAVRSARIVSVERLRKPDSCRRT